MINGLSNLDLVEADCKRHSYELQRIVNQQQVQLDYNNKLIRDIAEDLQNLRRLVNKLIEE